MDWTTQTNVILPDELCIKYSGYWKTWNRVLYMDREEVHFVEMNLTPVNPGEQRSWVNQVYPLLVRVHSTRMQSGDRLYRSVVKNKTSVVYNELKKAMMGHVAIELMFRLLSEDFIEKIDWNKYEQMRKSPAYYGGGVPFALIKRSPA